MTATQTITFPASGKMTVDIPKGFSREQPVILTFTQPKPALCNEVSSTKKPMTAEEEKKWINDNIEWLTNESLEDLAIQNMYLEESNK